MAPALTAGPEIPQQNERALPRLGSGRRHLGNGDLRAHLDVFRAKLREEARDERDADTLGRGQQNGSWPLVDQRGAGAEPPRRTHREIKIIEVERRDRLESRLGSEQRQGRRAEHDHEDDGESRARGRRDGRRVCGGAGLGAGQGWPGHSAGRWLEKRSRQASPKALGASAGARS